MDHRRRSITNGCHTGGPQLQ